MAKETLVASVAGLKQQVQSLIGMIGTASRNAAASMEGNGGTISTGSNFLNNYLGSFSSNASTRAVSRMNAIGGIAQGTFSAVGGLFNAMPDVGATIQRAGTYYDATLRAGAGMSRRSMQQATFSALRDGITSPGSDAMVSGYLAQRGMMASANFGSTYQQTVRSVGNAAKYLNMSNERAVAAVEGLTSGQGSSNMLRNFGIFTGDLGSGKEKTQGQIFGELYGRMTAGQGKASEEETLASLRRGNLGAMLRNSGLSEDQQSMFAQYAIERSRGNNMDLSDSGAMDELMKKADKEGNKNPFLPGYKLNTSKTGAMQSAESAYIAGIEAATPALQFMTEAAGNAAGALGALKAAAALFAGSAVGQGVGQMIGGVGGAVGNGMILRSGGKGGGTPLGGITGAGSSAGNGVYYNAKTGRYHDANTKRMVKTPAGMTAGTPGGNKFNLGTALKGAKVPGIAGAALTAATVLPGAVSAAQAGAPMGETVGNAIGSIAGGAIGGALGQALIPIPGLGFMIGSMAGSMLGGMAGSAIGGAMDGAGGDSGQSNGADSGAPKKLSLIHPINPAKISARFNQREYGGEVLWPNGHNGIDYSASMGQTIFAAADGTVVKVSSAGELGNHVVIKHDSGHYTFYCHLSSMSASAGPIKQGTPVGGAGKTGRATGVHLHFALSTSASTANCIDPMPYITGTATEETYSAEQTSEGGTPNAQGDTTGRGKQDQSDSSSGSSNSILTITKTGYAVSGSGGAGMSNASGLKSWGAGNVSSTGSGAASSNPDQPTGGDGYIGPDGDDSILVSTLKNKRTGSASAGGRTTTNHVTINLSINKATEDEAKKFTQMLKRNLEEQTLLKNMARK